MRGYDFISVGRGVNASISDTHDGYYWGGWVSVGKKSVITNSENQLLPGGYLLFPTTLLITLDIKILIFP